MRLKTAIKNFVFISIIPHFFLSADPFYKLTSINQTNLLQFWDKLSPEEREDLKNQIEKIDIPVLIAQKNAVTNSETINNESVTPFHEYSKNGSESDFTLGKKLIAEGKVGCLVVAGGQGTRLQCNGPKGLFPVTVTKQKTLFQLLAERVLAAGKQANRRLPIAIMTSPANHVDTVSYFEKNNYFGLNASQVYFFTQEELPFLDKNGNLFLESTGKIATGPDGNAASLKLFVKNGIWSKWHRQGVQYINYIHIDNPLADPFDAELSGFHNTHNADVVIKCIERNDPMEKVGVIMKKNGKVNVIEYSEISPEERDARAANGVLKHICCNISIFSFGMGFVRNVAMEYYDQLPFHKAWKAVKCVTPTGETKMVDKPMAWKFEKFIFDVLPFANSVYALLYPRAECFAPLKNVNGTDSIVDVQNALQSYDRATYAKISGLPVADSQVFELDPQFYYPTPELLLKWHGKSLPSGGYIAR